MEFIDLHVHSTASDGTLSPAEVVRRALGVPLAAIALTDHDTVDGIAEAMAAAGGTPLEVVPGTELSCDYEGTEIHMLGLFIDSENPALRDFLTNMRKTRDERNLAMLKRFEAGGLALTHEDLTGGNPDTVITRAHFARALLSRGYVSSMDQAFKKYLSPGKPYFIPREKIRPERAIELIAGARGLPVLAHPVQYRLGWKKTEELARHLTEAGLKGMEVYYSSHTPGQTARLQVICRACGLLPSGGSDFHGSNKPDIELGSGRGGLRVPRILLEDLKEAHSSIISGSASRIRPATRAAR